MHSKFIGSTLVLILLCNLCFGLPDFPQFFEDFPDPFEIRVTDYRQLPPERKKDYALSRSELEALCARSLWDIASSAWPERQIIFIAATEYPDIQARFASYMLVMDPTLFPPNMVSYYDTSSEELLQWLADLLKA